MAGAEEGVSIEDFDLGDEQVPGVQAVDVEAEIGMAEQLAADNCRYDDEGYLKQAWVDRQAEIQSFMVQARLTGQRLILQDDLPGLVTQLIDATGLPVSEGQLEFHLEQLEDAIKLATVAEPLAKRVRGDLGTATMQRIRDAGAVVATVDTMAVKRELGIPMKGTRLRRVGRRCLASDAQTPGERELAEKQDRDHWTSVLIGFLMEGNLPSVLLARMSDDPYKVLQGAAGRTRGSTMRSYLRAWKRFRFWLLLVYNLSFPSDPVQLVDYLHVLREEPCGRTVPKKFLQAASWLEGAGGVALQARLSMHPLVRKTMEYCDMELAAGSKVAWQAPRFPAIVIVSLEIFVCSEGNSDFLRFCAFCLLMLIWGTLRFDDVQHLCPRCLRIVDDALVGQLKQTKTTGPGKRVPSLQLVVGLFATLTNLGWVRAGLAIMKRLGDLDRDYLWMRSLDGEGKEASSFMARYSDAIAATRLVLSLLNVPEVSANSGWIAKGGTLIPKPFYGFWSLHSGRSCLPSILALLSIAKGLIDYLGRWSPSGSDVYVRTYKLVVLQLQQKVVDAYQSGYGITLLREGDIADACHRFLVERLAYSDEHAEQIILEWNRVSSQVHTTWTTSTQHMGPAVGLSDLVAELEADPPMDPWQ